MELIGVKMQHVRGLAMICPVGNDSNLSDSYRSLSIMFNKFNDLHYSRSALRFAWNRIL